MCYVKAINEVDLISCKMAHLATGNPCRPHRKPYFHKIAILTRTHSSRMRTIRCSRGMSARGCLPMEECLPRGVSSQGGGGVCLVGVSATPPPPPPREQNDRHICENITFPQLRCGR